MNLLVVSSEVETSLELLTVEISRDSSTPVRSARNDNGAVGRIYRGIEAAMKSHDSLNRYTVMSVRRFNDSTLQRFNEAKPFLI
jgi:hypothetical protein